MISFKQYLEEVRSAPLYHATSMDAAYSIIKDGFILPKTAHELSRLQAKNYVISKFQDGKWIHDEVKRGVSLTRNYAFAKQHPGSEVIFVFNRDLLRQRTRLIPIQYWDINTSRVQHHNDKNSIKRNEFEEFFLSDKGIPVKYAEMVYVKSVNDGDYRSIQDALDVAGLGNIKAEKMK